MNTSIEVFRLNVSKVGEALTDVRTAVSEAAGKKAKEIRENLTAEKRAEEKFFNGTVFSENQMKALKMRGLM